MLNATMVSWGSCVRFLTLRILPTVYLHSFIDFHFPSESPSSRRSHSKSKTEEKTEPVVTYNA